MRKTETFCDICGERIDVFCNEAKLIRAGLIKRHLDYEVCSECFNQIEDFVKFGIKKKSEYR